MSKNKINKKLVVKAFTKNRILGMHYNIKR